MSRLVVVSNRVPDPAGGVQAGGLAVALDALLDKRGGLWFGWSGKIAPAHKADQVQVLTAGRTDYATIDLTREEHDRYYNNFSNGVLWPLLHTMPELMSFQRRDAQIYRDVNTRMAKTLAPMLRPSDLVWIHDYHLMAMPAALRASGVHNPIGFFLHIPFPSADLISTAPEVSDLVQDLLAADLIGFQTANDLENFVAAAQSVAGAGQMSGGSLAVGTRRVRLGVFPVEIESREFAAMAEEFARGEVTMRLLNCMKGQKLILGVDRLDPTKGLLQRLAAMRRLLERHPDWDRHVTLLQIAAVSRKDVTSYRDLRLALNREAGALNSDLGDPDWQPLRLIAKGGRREHMAGYMRHAQVGLVTPLRDGMNLVAKEFVAAQDPLNPGVLVLSRFAGAARQLDAALLVNPHDTDEMADTLDTALRMGLAERQERWQSMWQVLQGVSPIGWGRAFLAALLRAASAQPQGMGQMGRPDMLPPGKIEAPRLTIVERVRSQMEAQRPPATIAPRRMI